MNGSGLLPVMRRRDFLKVITGSAAVWPLTAHAQQPIPAIGYLSAAALDDYTTTDRRAFRQGLKEIGLVEERDLTILFHCSRTAASGCGTRSRTARFAVRRSASGNAAA